MIKRTLVLALLLTIIPSVQAQPNFSLGMAAGGADQPIAISLSFDNGGDDVRRAAVTIAYDPNHLEPASDCSSFLQRDIGDSRLICLDFPTLGLMEITISAFDSEPQPIASVSLGRIRFLATPRSSTLQYHPPIHISVQETTFFGPGDVSLQGGGSKSGMIYAFENWPLDDSEGIDSPRFPVFTQYDGVTMRLLGGAALIPLTFHTASDVDWIALPGDKVGTYQINADPDSTGVQISAFNMGDLLTDPNALPIARFNLCLGTDPTGQLPINTPGALLLKVEPCSWDGIALYQLVIEDEAFPDLTPVDLIKFDGWTGRFGRQPTPVILRGSNGTAVFSDPATGFFTLPVPRSIDSIELISDTFLLQSAQIFISPNLSIGPFPAAISGQKIEVSPQSYSARPGLTVLVNFQDPIFRNSFEEIN